jgi:hypothetical protein
MIIALRTWQNGAMRPRSFSFLILVALAIIASACGSNGSSTTATTAQTQADRDKALASRLTLTANDLPPGWQTTNDDQSGNNVATGVYNQLDSCLGLANAATERTVSFSGDSFNDGGNNISSGASAFKTVGDVTTQLQGISNTANQNCILAVLNSVVAATLSNAVAGARPQSQISTIDQLNLSADQFGLRITSRLTTQSINQTLYTDLIGVAKGRFVTTAALNYLGTSPTLGLEQQVLQALQSHADAAVPVATTS